MNAYEYPNFVKMLSKQSRKIPKGTPEVDNIGEFVARTAYSVIYNMCIP